MLTMKLYTSKANVSINGVVLTRTNNMSGLSQRNVA